MVRHRLSRFCLLLALVLALTVTSVAAQDASRVRITRVNAEQFPTITVTLLAQGADGSAVADLSALEITEDGQPVTPLELESVQTGIDLVFVVNANRTINERDATTSTRREKVRDAINRFADNAMDQAQRDRITIVVPPGGAAADGFLLKSAIFVNEVKNAINFYEPTPAEVDLNSLLNRAIDHLATTRSEGRFQAIVLFTDGATERNLLDYDALNARLAEQEITFYAAILGQRADDTEIANVAALYEPSFGAHVHMPDAPAIDALYARVNSYRQQQRVRFRSSVIESGTYRIQAQLGGASAAADVEVSVGLPTVTILLDDSQPIKRVAGSAEMPLDEMQPRAQTVVAQVSWASGQSPREIVSAELLVDGSSVATADNVSVDADGVFSMEWDISQLDQGAYALVVAVTDELGVVANSDPLRLGIEVERPVLTTAEPDAVPTAASAGSAAGSQAGEAAEVVSDNIEVISIVGGALAILFALFVLFLAFVFMRRRTTSAAAATPASAAPVAATAQPAFDVESTQIMAPSFVQRKADAYLEALENASEHVGPVYVTGNNVALGRDAKLAQIVFKDKSVSRLHARIMQTGGEFRLYDEGSASGTYHNYERVGLTPQTLKDNDDVHLGRVHLRFRIATPAGDDDATQVFGPAAQPGPARQPAAPPPGGDDLSTQPYIPHSPAAPPGPAPGPGPAAPGDEEDPDDLSTQPFVPHQ